MSMIQSIQNKLTSLVVSAKTSLRNIGNSCRNEKGEGYVDSGVKILIAVVIGALLLTGLYALFNTTILPTVTSKIKDLFSYSGT